MATIESAEGQCHLAAGFSVIKSGFASSLLMLKVAQGYQLKYRCEDILFRILWLHRILLAHFHPIVALACLFRALPRNIVMND